MEALNKIRYPSLNGLRALSILLVLFHHLKLNAGVMKDWDRVGYGQVFFRFIQDGQMGVNVFFVISGFLITSLMLHEEAVTKTVSLKKFYIRRTIRIFPAYYFMLLVYFVLQVNHVIHIDRMSWVTAITYTKYLNWSDNWYTAHAWSLSIEEQFYLCWPLIFLAGKRIRVIAAIAMICIVPFVRVYVNHHPSSSINDLTLFMRIDAIATGCLFALYKDRIIQALSPHFALYFYLSFLILFCFPYSELFHLGVIFVPIGQAHGTVANFLIAIILMYSIFGPRGIWFRLLNLRIVNYIGLLSYSIYLWQQLFISGSPWWVAKFPQNILCIGVAALCSYYFIEKPFNKLKARFAAKGTDKVPQITAVS